MPALWDEGLKRLLRASPQDFISWLAPGATYQKMLLTELYRKLDSHRNVIADSMCLCRLHDQDVIIHIEFQSEGDRQMAMRLLEYNLLADREYSCPVLSCVIYVRRDYGIAASPLTRRLPDGSLVYQFHFLTISLWEHSAQELLEGNLPGLLALLPLTRDGKDPAVIDEMIVRLQAHDNYEMLSLSYLFSALTWTREDEREWIQRRFAMLRDELQESWAYQEILQEGEQKGQRAEVIKLLLAIVETHFPELLPQAKALVGRERDVPVLERLVITLTTAQSVEEASQSLSNGAGAA